MTRKQFEKGKHEADKLQKRLRHMAGDAIADYNMIEEGDRVMVCMSGGKDSHVMLDILMSLQRSAPVKFELIAVNLDQKQPGFPERVLPAYFEKIGVPYRIVERDTYSIVKRLVPEGETTCSVCSRLRRGHLYGTALELGATKIALGHHRDDILATMFLNMFYGGTLKAMPPKLHSDDGKHIVIRPLAYCKEKDIAEYAQVREFPIIPCDLCGSQPDLQRAVIKNMLNDWDRQFPGRLETMFRAVKNVRPRFLMDNKLFDFAGLKADPVTTGQGDFEGDIGFDVDSDLEKAMNAQAGLAAAVTAAGPTLPAANPALHPVEGDTIPDTETRMDRLRRMAELKPLKSVG